MNMGKRTARDTVTRDLMKLLALQQMQITSSDERWARLEAERSRVEQELRTQIAALFRLLEQLPDAIREKIGFVEHAP